MKRRFVGVRNPCKMRNFTSQCLLVKALDIALGQYRDWTVNVHFDEVRNVLPHFLAHGPVRRNSGHDDDHAMPRQQFADESNAANVDVAIFLAEPQALREMRADYISVEHLNLGS